VLVNVREWDEKTKKKKKKQATVPTFDEGRYATTPSKRSCTAVFLEV
jgi:hypothetical protein